MIIFPISLRSHRMHSELVDVTERVVGHPALTSKDPGVIRNVIRASLLATICFYRNLSACLRHEMVRVYSASPFYIQTDGSFLHLLLELCGGELAASNMPDATGFEPHYCSMLRAAKAAGIKTAAAENLVSGKCDLPACPLAPEAIEYLSYSARCCETFDDAFATIALRELTLAESFKQISRSLPQSPNYRLYRGFVEAHIELDECEHASLIVKALEHFGDADRLIRTMIEFYSRRACMYDACLSERPLF